MIKIEGLDVLTRQLAEIQAILAALNGELGIVSFDSTDPVSVEAAIQEVERLVDGRLGHCMNNPEIASLAEQMKAHYRQAIIDKALQIRLENNS